VHLRFAPGEDYPPDPKFSQRLEVRLQVVDCNLPDLLDPPDVTHHATAIATIVREQNEDWQRAKVRIETCRRAMRGIRDGLQVGQSNTLSKLTSFPRKRESIGLAMGPRFRAGGDSDYHSIGRL